jgi:hypothetical protein
LGHASRRNAPVKSAFALSFGLQLMALAQGRQRGVLLAPDRRHDRGEFVLGRIKLGSSNLGSIE